jgi:hypothetical protein
VTPASPLKKFRLPADRRERLNKSAMGLLS